MDTSDPIYIIATLATSVAGLLLLVIRAKVPAFFALLLVSLIAGLLLGLDPASVVASIQNGMAGVLGFIAVVVGLGAILGAVLEQSGGVKALSDRLAHGSVKSIPTKMSFLGLLVAIPVFFDVALVILMPMVKRLATTIQRKPLYVAAPLLAGLGAAHAFIPPTPGPIAVAALLDADLGLVILAGLVAAVPAILCGGVVFARRQYDQPIAVERGPASAVLERPVSTATFLSAFLALAFPIVLVASGTVLKISLGEDQVPSLILFLSHPFVALLLTVGLYYTFAATQLELPASSLNQAAMKSLEPAGAVVLVTGAGGAFKQVLIDSQAGARIAELAASANVSVLIFAFMIAGLVRVIQGSATVAMITAAGFTAPLLAISGISDFDRALAVISIAAGATILSHVNDSGFWLVSKYLDLSVNETLKSWTIVSTLVGGVGFVTALLLSLVF